MKQEQFIATLVGCAVGDALGMPVEGWPKARIKKHVGRITEMIDPVILRDNDGNKITEDEFGKLRYWTEVFEKGEYTDDTILTLAIAESIIERGLPDIHHITRKQLEIYQEYSAGRGKCGFGGTTKAAFENVLQGVPPLKSGVIGGPGTGPAMKMAPIGMWMALQPANELDGPGPYDAGRGVAGAYLAKLVGRSTHLDPRSIVCGVLQALAIDYLLKRGVTLSSRELFIEFLYDIARVWEEPLTPIYKWHHKGTIHERLRWINQNLDATLEEAHTHLGSSSATYQAYPFTLWMFQKYFDDPVAGLEEIVNCGGDCDTTGAMFGALAGARHGMIFPEKWTSQIEDLDEIVGVGKKFYNLDK
jgi:ADP-ribosylglycohydrolase